jgi:hypothetical protein
MIRIAMIKNLKSELLIKAFFAEDVEDAQSAAADWVAKNLGRDEDFKIVYPELCYLVVDHYVVHDATCANPPVVHSHVLSNEDREFLTGCLIRWEDLGIQCCGQGQHPNVVPVDEVIKKLEDLRDRGDKNE